MVGIIWSVYWWYFSYERPAIHPKISEHERVYIEESIGEASSIANKVCKIKQSYLLLINFETEKRHVNEDLINTDESETFIFL